MVETVPLSGVRVLDLTRSIAGPWTTRMLADAGAEVVKLEPLAGDFIRQLPARTGEYSSGYFRQANAGKRSIAIDLHTQRGLSLLRELVPHFDVVMHNMRPNAARRLGITAEQIHDLNPDAIFCCISGYGSDSIYVEKPGQDLALQCMTGIAALTGVADGEPAVPIWSLVDTLTSAYTYTSICSALLSRRRRGLNRIAVEVSMVECCALLHDVGPYLLREPEVPKIERSGQFHPTFVVRGVVQVSNGIVAISGFRKRHWARLAPILGPEFADRGMSFGERLKRKDQIESRLIELIRELSVKQALDKLHGNGVPAYQVLQSLEDVATTGLFQKRGMLVPTDGMLLVSSILHGQTCAEHLKRGSPALGEATFEILNGMLGLGGGDILELLSQSIIGCEPSALEKLVLQCSEAESGSGNAA